MDDSWHQHRTHDFIFGAESVDRRRRMTAERNLLRKAPILWEFVVASFRFVIYTAVEASRR